MFRTAWTIRATAAFRALAYDMRVKECLEGTRLSALAVGSRGFSRLTVSQHVHAPPDAPR